MKPKTKTKPAELSCRVKVPVTADEHARLRFAAMLSHVTMAEFTREAAIGKATSVLKDVPGTILSQLAGGPAKGR